MDPNTGVPLYDPCHAYTGTDYSACFANGGSLPTDSTAVDPTYWYDQPWFPILIGIALISIIGYLVYLANARRDVPTA